jgi:hypothetical protein
MITADEIFDLATRALASLPAMHNDYDRITRIERLILDAYTRGHNDALTSTQRAVSKVLGDSTREH